MSKTGLGGISGAWKALAKTVNCKMNCARLILIALVSALMVQHCWAFSAAQMKKALEHLALPRVNCSARSIKAIFAPLVKSNIHVKGKLSFFYCNSICPTAEMGVKPCMLKYAKDVKVHLSMWFLLFFFFFFFFACP